MDSAEDLAAKSLRIELELAQKAQHAALAAARAQGAREALENKLQPEVIRHLACTVVESWVRTLAESHQGMDISVRKAVALWCEEGRIESQTTLYGALTALEEKQKAEGEEHAEGTKEHP